MDEKRTPVIAGLGGAALIAALMSVGGSSAPPADSTKSAAIEASSPQSEITANQEGPWYAFCNEYATTEFDRGIDPAQEKGIKGHRVPLEAEDGTVELTRSIKSAYGPEKETFSVRKHTVGNLPDCVTDGTTLRIAVAIVPDPNATLMPLEFDRDIDAIQAAAAQEGYTYTRFWFPWRANDSQPDKASEPEAEIRRREEPGILCFRKTDAGAGGERLFVLLVGETPTSGVSRVQLAHALDYRYQLRKQKNFSLADSDEIEISGPHFSASFAPTEDVLTQVYVEWEQDALNDKSEPPLPATHLVSPDASGQDFIDQFWKFCAAFKPACTLQTLSLSSKEAQSVEFNYLVNSLGYHPQRIAQLNEDESAFGATFGGIQSQHPGDPSPKDRPQDAEPPFGLRLHFPRDLSSVRSLSDAESARVAASGSKYISLPEGLPPTQLSAREPIDRDSPAAFGSEQEAAQAARSLADAVVVMRAHRIQAVVINASNPLDRVYLLEYLHNELPNVRAATTDADELELDRPHFVDLTGTIAVSALPALAGMSNVVDGSISSKDQSSNTNSPMSFKSSRQEGEFLAIEMLLDPVQQPATGTNPCYSISVVGENGFQLMPYGSPDKSIPDPTFPCYVLMGTGEPSPATKSAGIAAASETIKYRPAIYMTTATEKTNTPSAFLVFLVALLLLNAIHLWCLDASRRGVDGLFSYPRLLDSSLEPTRLYLLFAVNNQLLLLNILATKVGYLSLVAVHRHGAHDWQLVALFALVASFLLMTLVFSIYLLAMFVVRVHRQKEDEKAKSQDPAQTGVALVYLGCTAWMILTLPALREGNGLFLERITLLGDGLSPVIPISAIFLAYFLWGWIQLRRLGWSVSRKVDLQILRHLNEYFYYRVTSVQTLLETLNPERRSVQTIAFVFAFSTAYVLQNSLNGFDGPWFRGWFLFWGVNMLLLAVTFSCFHAWSIWAHLKKLLDWLETTSMRETFQQVGKSGLLQVKIWDLAETQRSFAVLKLTVQSIVRMEGPNSDLAKEANHQVAFFMRADANRRQIPAGRIGLLNKALNSSMDDAVTSISEGTPSEGIPPCDPDELQLFLALRLVSLIRYAMLQIRTLMCFVVYGYVLAVVSVTFYAFQGRKTIGGLLMLTFVGLLIWIGRMMSEFQQNSMLSRLEGSTPGQANYWQIALHLLTVGGLPLLAIVSSQFPAVANFALSLFRPVLGALK